MYMFIYICMYIYWGVKMLLHWYIMIFRLTVSILFTTVYMYIYLCVFMYVYLYILCMCAYTVVFHSNPQSTDSVLLQTQMLLTRARSWWWSQLQSEDSPCWSFWVSSSSLLDGEFVSHTHTHTFVQCPQRSVYRQLLLTVRQCQLF